MKSLKTSIIKPKDEGNSFENCKLGREIYAKSLTSIIRNYKEGFVLAINNKWGEGKTTFIEMWRDSLKEEFQSVYFNAWENDFDENASIALMSEMKTLSTAHEQNILFESLAKKSAILFKGIMPTLIKGIAEHYIGQGNIAELFGKVTEASSEVFKYEIDTFANKKQSLKEFKEEFEEFIKLPKKPLIFFIDELDRCKPNYAVEVLENIKHFFSVPNVVFVLSIDKEQLANSIKGYYGSDCINGMEYLRRFIDIEYSLPMPDSEKYIEFLFSKYEFENLVRPKDVENHKLYLKRLFTTVNMPLRSQEQMFIKSKLVFSSCTEGKPFFPILISYLIYLSEYKNEQFLGICKRSKTLNQVIDDHAEIFRSQSVENNRILVYGEFLLIVTYANYLKKNIDLPISDIDNHPSLKDISSSSIDISELKTFLRNEPKDYTDSFRNISEILNFLNFSNELKFN
jgi:hypothetical protein